ncbi:hypothetical protein NA57DRAFT_73775 [Rhizodiscina lignyota]|uniref:Uncharacterized protein n=1 Tax=Rhizodiscina lignyota TaxID=1504668 RepID=A0A9P4MCD9_9PEZI|nr:hypothetical protein NA57DRAFT_73775 [Rhizodiscina lignyota]
MSYFSHFPGFVPDPTTSFNDEFARLAQHQGWERRSNTWRQERGRAIQSEFSTQYGASAEKLAGWQALCNEVGIDPLPQSITQCRKALKGVLVNNVDLVDARRTGQAVHVFDNFRKFRRHTRGRTFPRGEAKEEGFLKALLRVIS